MSESITFTIPGKPTPWRRIGGARRNYDSQRAIKDEIGWLCKTARFVIPITGKGIIDLFCDGPVSVKAYFYFPRPRTTARKQINDYPYPDIDPDIDNCVKLILDSLNGIAWVDDNQVVSIQARKLYALEPSQARSVVRITPMNQSEHPVKWLHS